MVKIFIIQGRPDARRELVEAIGRRRLFVFAALSLYLLIIYG
jgi:hypothetical protein